MRSCFSGANNVDTFHANNQAKERKTPNWINNLYALRTLWLNGCSRRSLHSYAHFCGSCRTSAYRTCKFAVLVKATQLDSALPNYIYALRALWLFIWSCVFLFLFASVFFLFLLLNQKEKENRKYQINKNSFNKKIKKQLLSSKAWPCYNG